MRCSAWEPLAGRQHRRHGRRAHRAEPTRASVASEGGEGGRDRGNRLLRFVRNEVPGSSPPSRGCGGGAGGELPAGGFRLRWITSCVEERGLGEGTEVCDRARGGGGGACAAVCSCDYQCNESFGRRNYNSPSSSSSSRDPSRRFERTARSAVVAEPPRLPLGPWWGSGAVTRRPPGRRRPLGPGASRGLRPAAGSASYGRPRRDEASRPSRGHRQGLREG